MCLIELRFRKGEYIFHGGDAGDGPYVAIAGAISIRLEKSDEGNAKRLICYAPGVVFGELAVLGNKPRSADAIADENAVVLRLTLDAFETLKREHPMIFGKILFNLSQQLADRLRAVTLDLRAAEL